MIFVTLGSQKFQFNRLLKKIDELIENGVIDQEVYAQTGYSDYIPKHYDYCSFLDRNEFEERVSKASILITHGGTGAIIGAVKKGIKVIAVPRLAQYNEHVDDHQVQLLQQFDEIGIIKACYDLDNLGECYNSIHSAKMIPYESHTKQIIDSIELFLQ